jgi:hypothetical protein
MMNKEEILEKSRAQKVDERIEFVKDKSLKWALITMAVLSGIFAFIRGQQNQPMMDLAVVVCGSTSVAFFYRYIKAKDTSDLICSIITFCVAILALIRYCMGH